MWIWCPFHSSNCYKGRALRSLVSPTDCTSRSFCVLFRNGLPRLLSCFLSHQGVQCSLAMRFHESHLALHQPLTPFPNLGAGTGNLTLLSCRFHRCWLCNLFSRDRSILWKLKSKLVHQYKFLIRFENQESWRGLEKCQLRPSSPIIPEYD